MILCPHADRCGGCPAIDRPLEAQLAFKDAKVQRACARYPALEGIALDPTEAAPTQSAYRTRAKLMVGPRAQIGLYSKIGDHVLVDIPDCKVMAPVLARATAALRIELTREAIPALRAIDLREVREPDDSLAILLTLIVDGRRPPSRERCQALARTIEVAIDVRTSTAVSFHGGDSPQVLGRDLTVVHGEGDLRDRIDEQTWTYAAHGAFVQAHREQAARIYHRLRDRLTEKLGELRGRVVVDAYAGSGAIGLVLAQAGAHVIAIESFAPAAERAGRAAHAQGLTLESRTSDAAIALESMRGRKVDAIVVDPPRRGLAPSLRLACAALEPAVIAVLSCEPETFARDLDHFARLGYRTMRAQPFDLMPLTEEVETFAMLERTAPVPPTVLYRDDELVALFKSAHEPTIPQDGRVRSLLERARDLPGLERAVPIHRLDVGTSGVCLFATEPHHVEGLVMTDKRYTALARGVARPKGTVQKPLRIDGATLEARTQYKRRAIVGGHSLLDVRIETGRTHQIRRHLAMIGHAVLGDERYGDAASNRYFDNKHGLDRTFLHCRSITVGDRAPIEAALPGELEVVLERAKGPR